LTSPDTTPPEAPEPRAAHGVEAARDRTAPGAAPRAGYEWYALGILFVVYVFNFIDRQIVSILQEPIKRDLGLSDAQLGLLTGFAFAVFYATLGIPIARLADRTSRSKVIAIALLVWSLMTSLCGAARSFATLLLFRIGVGVGEAGCSPPAHSLISDYFPANKRATALGIYSTGIYVGVMFGYLAGGWINEFFGWRRAFMAVGLPGALFSVVVFFTLREPPRGLSDGRAARSGAVKALPLGDVFRLLWSQRSFRHLSFGAALHAFVSYGAGGWLPPFFMRVHGMSSGEVGTWLGLIAGIIGGAGTFAGGWAADRLGARDRRWYCWVCVISLIVHAPLSIAGYLAGNPYLALGLYLIPAFMGPVYNAPNFAMTQGLVPLGMRAAAAAVLLFVINLIGMGLGPAFVGWVSDLLEPSVGIQSLRYALLMSTAFNLWSAVHYLLAARTLREELATAETLDRQ
jgi:predicted MFS family arabinose efflux permease